CRRCGGRAVPGWGAAGAARGGAIPVTVAGLLGRGGDEAERASLTNCTPTPVAPVGLRSNTTPEGPGTNAAGGVRGEAHRPVKGIRGMQGITRQFNYRYQRPRCRPPEWRGSIGRAETARATVATAAAPTGLPRR